MVTSGEKGTVSVACEAVKGSTGISGASDVLAQSFVRVSRVALFKQMEPYRSGILLSGGM